jgi:hypothetical protein
MKVIDIVSIIGLILLIGCSQKSDINYVEIENEITNLESLGEKKTYLEQILEDDQSVRNPQKSSEIINEFGRNSKEYHDYGKAMRQQDDINLFKIEKYLSIHGYPDKEMGQMAITAPWMVIHHAQGYEARERNFGIIYSAYKNGSIDVDALSFYLGRMYELKFGERHRMENPYQMEDEVVQLMKKLEIAGK